MRTSVLPSSRRWRYCPVRQQSGVLVAFSTEARQDGERHRPRQRPPCGSAGNRASDVDEPSTVLLSEQGVKQSEVLAILRGDAPNAAHYLCEGFRTSNPTAFSASPTMRMSFRGLVSAPMPAL